MRRLLFLIFTCALPAVGARAADTGTYAQGFKAGWDAAMQVIVPSGGSSGGSQNDIGQSVTYYRGSGGSGGGSNDVAQPSFWIVPTQQMPGGSGDAVTGGAIPFFGKIDLGNKDSWTSIVDQASAKSGLSGDKLSLYAVPAGPLIDNQSNISGFVLKGDASNAVPRAIDLGNAETALKTFGAVPILPNSNLVMMAQPASP